MDLWPREDRIVIVPEDPERITASGIHLPDNAVKKSRYGTVVAKGPGKWQAGQFVPLDDVEVGDRVYFSDYGGIEMRLDDQLLLIVYSRDVHAVVK